MTPADAWDLIQRNVEGDCGIEGETYYSDELKQAMQIVSLCVEICRLASVETQDHG